MSETQLRERERERDVDNSNRIHVFRRFCSTRHVEDGHDYGNSD